MKYMPEVSWKKRLENHKYPHLKKYHENTLNAFHRLQSVLEKESFYECLKNVQNFEQKCGNLDHFSPI